MSPPAIDLIRTIVAIGLGFLAMAIASEAIDVFRKGPRP